MLSGSRLVIWFALLAGTALADIAKLISKAAELESALQARIASACTPDGSSATCVDLEQRRLAAKKVKDADTSGLQGQAAWTEFVEALQRMPNASTLSDDVDSWIHEQMYTVLTMDDLKILGTMQSGTNMTDAYFWGDVREEPQEQQGAGSRRLQGTTWQGPRLAAGRPWPNRTLVYAYHPNISWVTRLALESAIKEVRTKTCVKFQEVEWNSPINHRKIIDDEPGCWASLGHRHDGGKLNLDLMCRFHAVAVHELLHALGQHHEQVRPDRDFFLEVNMENVVAGMEHNFDVKSNAYTGRAYDLKSVMHYGRFVFSKFELAADPIMSWTLTQLSKAGLKDVGSPTIKARNSYFEAELGNLWGMTDNDIEQLQDMYQCSKLPVSSTGSPGWGIRWSGWNGIAVGTGEEAVAVECNAGYAVTSCSCYHEGGDCRGATLSEVTGGTCVAAGKKMSGAGIKAHAICIKLDSPHYAVTRMSATQSRTASQTCSSRYTLVGCSCIALEGANCKASPDFSGTEPVCTATSFGSVRAQAICLRSPGLGNVQLIDGQLASESVAQCPEGTELTGCSCAGVGQCKGARPAGDNSNSCHAYAMVSDGRVVAKAICASLLPLDGSDPLVSAAAGYLIAGGVKEPSKINTEFMPIQSAYCNSSGFLDSVANKNGCTGIAMQTRQFAQYSCGAHSAGARCRFENGVAKCNDNRDAKDAGLGCKQIDLRVSAAGANVTKVNVSNEGTARCPAGFFVGNITCLNGCKSFELTCVPPPKEAAWFLSGGRTLSSWFNGGANGPQSAMGTCGHGVAIGLECASSAVVKDTSCFLLRLTCRRVAIAGADTTERHSDFDLSFSEPAWSNWISDTGLSEKITEWQFKENHARTVQNPDYRPAQKLQCNGDYCDNLRFEIATKFGTWGSYKQLKGKPTAWTAGFGEYEMICPAGQYVASMKCTKSYCYQKELLCAEPDSDEWHVGSRNFYSHCFTNKAAMDWMNWFRDRAHSIRGQTRTCTGMQPSQMPNSQSCGEDGIIVGVRCFGKDCDRLQLVCSSIEANINLTTGASGSVSSTITELKQLGLYEDTSLWQDPPKNGKPSTWKWDGQQLVKPGEAAFMVSAALQAATSGLLFAVLLAAVWASDA